MDDFKILSDIENLEYDDANQIAKSLDISFEKAEEILKDIEKRGLIEIDYSDEDIAPGEVLKVIYQCILADKGKNILNNKKGESI